MPSLKKSTYLNCAGQAIILASLLYLTGCSHAAAHTKAATLKKLPPDQQAETIAHSGLPPAAAARKINAIPGLTGAEKQKYDQEAGVPQRQ